MIQKSRLKQMLSQMDDPKFNSRSLSELLYTAYETGIIQEESPMEDPVTLYKILELSKTITEVELKEIRM